MSVGCGLQAAESADVQAAAATARAAVDELLWQRSLRAKGSQLAAEVTLANAQASAMLEGADLPLPAWRNASAFDGSPMGRVALGVWRLESELNSLESIWSVAPGQALARMHSLVGAGLVDPDHLGRPRQVSEQPPDPMHLGSPRQGLESAAEPTPVAAAMLAAVRAGITADPRSETAVGEVPAVVRAGTVHAELAWLRPFAFGNGPIARGSSRLVLATWGLDPNLLVAVDAAMTALGRPAYVRALRAYARGDAGGAADWMIFYCRAVAAGAAISGRLLALL